MPRKATYGVPRRPSRDCTRSRSSGAGTWKVSMSTPWYATSMRVESADSTRTSSSLVAFDGTIVRLARCSAVLMADRKNGPLTGWCTSGWVKKVTSWIVTRTGRPARSGIV